MTNWQGWVSLGVILVLILPVYIFVTSKYDEGAGDNSGKFFKIWRVWEWGPAFLVKMLSLGWLSIDQVREYVGLEESNERKKVWPRGQMVGVGGTVAVNAILDMVRVVVLYILIRWQLTDLWPTGRYAAFLVLFIYASFATTLVSKKYGAHNAYKTYRKKVRTVRIGRWIMRLAGYAQMVAVLNVTAWWQGDDRNAPMQFRNSYGVTGLHGWDTDERRMLAEVDMSERMREMKASEFVLLVWGVVVSAILLPEMMGSTLFEKVIDRLGRTHTKALFHASNFIEKKEATEALNNLSRAMWDDRKYRPFSKGFLDKEKAKRPSKAMWDDRKFRPFSEGHLEKEKAKTERKESEDERKERKLGKNWIKTENGDIYLPPGSEWKDRIVFRKAENVGMTE
jgi:hypothetical protein